VFSINPRVPAKHRGIIHSPDRLEAQLVVLISVLDVLGEASGFKRKFKGLLAEFPQVVPSAMGFPANWEALAFWKT
jgi:hypothetical protein